MAHLLYTTLVDSPIRNHRGLLVDTRMWLMMYSDGTAHWEHANRDTKEGASGAFLKRDLVGLPTSIIDERIVNQTEKSKQDGRRQGGSDAVPTRPDGSPGARP